MPHPCGGQGSVFQTTHNFYEAYNYIVKTGAYEFKSTSNENIMAVIGTDKTGTIPTIVFHGEHTRHGNVCEACWGFRSNCSKTHIGQCVEVLDQSIL
jgi:maltose-binding protein MalE